jgi:hypothetical protein
MYIRELCSQARVTIAAENILLDVYEIDGAEDMGEVKAEVRVYASGRKEGERGM